MRCPKCGSDNTDDERFCRSCGARLLSVPDVKDESAPALVSVTAVSSVPRPDGADALAPSAQGDGPGAEPSWGPSDATVQDDADMSWETLGDNTEDVSDETDVPDDAPKRDERDFSDYDPSAVRGSEDGDDSSIPFRPYVAPSLPKPKRASSTGRRYLTQRPLQRSWRALTNNDNWLWEMLRLGLVMLIPVYGFIVVTGYVYHSARSVMLGEESPLPEQVMSVRNLRDGLRPCIVGGVLGFLLWMVLVPVRSIPYVGQLIAALVALLCLPFIVSCNFRAAVCESVGSGFNMQYAARLINRDFGQVCGFVILPVLLAGAIAAAFTFIWLLCAIVLVGSSISSITLFRYSAAAQLAAVSPAIYFVLLVIFVILAWFSFTALTASRLVYTRAFAYFCSPLEMPLWPDFESAQISATERGAQGFDAVEAAIEKEKRRAEVERAEVLNRVPALSQVDGEVVLGKHSPAVLRASRRARGRTRGRTHTGRSRVIRVGATARVALVNAQTGGPIAIGRFPFAVGKGHGVSLQVPTPDGKDMIYACVLEDGWGGYRIETMEYGGLTFVNGFDLDAHTTRLLEDGDVLVFGSEEYRFEIL
jgi:hypothetical protein